MTIKPKYTPDELETLFRAISSSPSWISRKFILKELCGWTEEMLTENLKMRGDEANATRSGDKFKGYS